MGQILSNLWWWICPKSTNNPPPPLYDPSTIHYITIPDQPSHPISGSSKPKAISNGNDTGLDPPTPHIVVDLSSVHDNKGRAEKINKKKESVTDHSSESSDRLIEVVLEKSVTTSTTFSHVPNNVGKIGQYNSKQRLLLVGEGDFSFSACLAIAFGGSAVNITATSLNSKKFLNKNYANFPTNEAELKSRGSMIIHGVDATDMLKHHVIGNMVFDRIIYNFPHAGKFGKSETELRAHQKLIRGFLRNAKKMIDKDDGEIHITSKSNGFFLEWDIPKMGSDHGLNLIQEVKFRRSKYPGYSPKYGFGGDKDFDCNPSKTYKFGFSFK